VVAALAVAIGLSSRPAVRAAERQTILPMPGAPTIRPLPSPVPGQQAAQQPIGAPPPQQPAPSPVQPQVQLKMTAARVAAFVAAAQGGLNYVPGEVLVKFRDGVTQAGEQRALGALRSQPSVADLQWVGPAAVVRDATQPDSTVMAAQLSAQPEVEYAEPNYLRRLPRQQQRATLGTQRSLISSRALPSSRTVQSTTPTDPDYAVLQWNLPLIGMPNAWDISPGGTATTIVAVVDTGFTTVNQSYTFSTWNGTAIQSLPFAFTTSPDFSQSRVLTSKAIDFTNFWTGPPIDMDGHGTHVASTVGEQTDNGVGLAGIAYNTMLLPVKVCLGFWEIQFAWSAAGNTGFVPLDAGGCTDDAIASGIRYAADNGAQVINLSLGGEGTSTTIQSALTYAVGKGVFIAMAVGNEYLTGNPTEYPAAYGPSISGAVAVTAVGQSSNRSYYANTGSYVEIAAPGGDDQDNAGASEGYVWQVTLYYPDNELPFMTGVIPRFDRFAEIGYEGTSMATPHVVGTAALLVSRGVTSPAAIEALIEQTAKNIGGGTGRNNTFGYGLIQPRAALFGYGIIK
jgi:serine protease